MHRAAIKCGFQSIQIAMWKKSTQTLTLTVFTSLLAAAGDLFVTSS